MNPWDLDLDNPEHFAAFDRFIMTSPLGNPDLLKSISFCNQPKTAPAASPKVGRNAPCPCGSGKKYKKCCDSPELHNEKYAA